MKTAPSLLAAAVILGLYFGASATAEVLELEGTIKAIDAEARSVIIVRKTPKGEKVLELEVAKNAGDLAGFRKGDKVTVAYDPTLELATKLSSPSNSAGSPQNVQDAAGFVDLISDDDLEGWHLTVRPQEKDKPWASGARNWEVRKGVLMNTDAGRHLATDQTYQDFELVFEFKVPPKCNNGIYLRGAYEVKLKDADPLETKPTERCGAIFGLVAPTASPFKGPNNWNTCKVVLQGDTVTVVINDTEVISEKQLPAQMPLHFNAQPDRPGPIVLHSHPKGVGIMYRNMKIRELP